MKARYPVGYQAFVPDGKDEYNNEIEEWLPIVERLIFGANGPESSEDVVAGPNRVVITRVLLIPPRQLWSPRDRVVLPDEPGFTYEVEGVVSDAKRNPFKWNPGGHIVVRRVDG